MVKFAKKKRRARNAPLDVFKQINMHEGDKDVCWEWGGVHRTGNRGEERPVISIGGTEYYVYRVVWELYNGRGLEAREVVRHRCDNTRCCNPYHLLVGTQKDNVADMMERERAGHKQADVKKIMQMLEIGCSSTYISTWMKKERDVDIDDSTIRRIKRRKFYRHIDWEWGDKYALAKGYILASDLKPGIIQSQSNNGAHDVHVSASEDPEDA